MFQMGTEVSLRSPPRVVHQLCIRPFHVIYSHRTFEWIINHAHHSYGRNLSSLPREANKNCSENGKTLYCDALLALVSHQRAHAGGYITGERDVISANISERKTDSSM